MTLRTAILILFSIPAWAQNPTPLSVDPNVHFNARLQKLELAVERLDAEIEVIKSQSTLMIQSSKLSFLNSAYFKAGLGLVLPRAGTFTGSTDTGLGFSVGGGHYFGRHHVVDLSIAWDLYIAAALRYRYEIHTRRSGLTIGPVVGYKVRLVRVDPFDRFITDPSELKGSYALAGLFLGMPTSAGAMITSEFTYHFNGQQLIFVQFGMHFFL